MAYTSYDRLDPVEKVRHHLANSDASKELAKRYEKLADVLKNRYTNKRFLGIRLRGITVASYGSREKIEDLLIDEKEAKILAEWLEDRKTRFEKDAAAYEQKALEVSAAMQSQEGLTL